MASTPLDAIGAALDAPVDAPELAGAGDMHPYGGRDDDDGLDRPPLAPDCPVQPLGILGQLCWYLDTNGQIISLEAGNRHGKNSLTALFGRKVGWLERAFPQWSAPVTEGRGANKKVIKESEIVGFDQAEASAAMIIACTEKGIFDPTGKIRGRGAHRGRNGGLVLHVGNKVFAPKPRVDGGIGKYEWNDPGVIDGHVYPTGSPIPRPYHKAVDTKAGWQVLELLRTWEWRRKPLDAILMLGWIAAAPLGGALGWRPNIWVTGGPGTGKSTLDGEGGVIDLLYGEALFKTGNASAAAIRQSLKNSTIPVIFDEIEASEDNRRVRDVVELARVSSSGSTIHRGGQDHQASEFTLRSCFLFSSINIPPLEPQDRQRLAILELNRFPAGAKRPPIETMNLPAIGAMIVRRMVDAWPRFADTLLAYHSAMAAEGHSPRACDQFGTLLACAHLLLYDDLSDAEVISDYVRLCDRRSLAEISDATPDEEACVIHILTSMVQARGGDEREALGSWIGRAVNFSVGAEDMAESARRRLQQIGIRIVSAEAKDPGPGGERRYGVRDLAPGKPGYLAIAQSHQALTTIFAGTKWQGGVWAQSLARHQGAIRSQQVKMGYANARSVLVPLAHVLDEAELPVGTPKLGELAEVKG